MKKKIIAVLLCGMLMCSSLGLAACANDNGGNITPTPPITNPDDPNKPDVPDDPNKPDVPEDPNKPIVPDDPDKPDEPGDPNKPVNPDDPDDPDDPGDGIPKLIDRVTTLAAGVDDLPSMSDVENISGVKKTAKRVGAAREDSDAERQVVDLSTPVQDIVSDYDSHYGQQVSFVDGTIREFKRTKDAALEVCRQFDVWVNAPDYFCDFRIGYDRELDAVTIEKRFDTDRETYYSEIRCAYDYLGRMTVRGSYAVYYNDRDCVSSFGVDYTEDASWTCAYNEPQQNVRFEFLLQADLSSAERAVTKQIISESTDGMTARYKTIISEQAGKPVVIDYDSKDADFYSDCFDVYDAAGGLMFGNRRESMGSHTLRINMYMIDGWDKIFYYPDESADNVNHVLHMTIGENEYIGSLSNKSDVSENSWTLSGSSYYVGQKPKPVIACTLYDDRSIAEFLAEWGLTIKSEYAEIIEYMCFGGWDFDEFMHGWTAFGIPGYVFTDDDDMVELYGDISAALGVYTLEKWNAEKDGIFAAAAISIDDQTANNEIYENIGIEISGSVSFVDTTVIDLSGVRCEIPASVLFEENGDYALTVALMSADALIELETLTVEYSRAGVTVSGFSAEKALPVLDKNEPYAFVAYLTKRSGGKTLRISDHRYIKGAEERELSTVGDRYVSRDTGGEIILEKVTEGRVIKCADVVTVEDVYTVEKLPAIVPRQSARPVFDVKSVSFDMTDIAFTYSATPFLSVGDEYKLVLSLDGEGASVQLGEQTDVVGGDGIAAAFDNIDLICPNADVGKEYKIMLSLYKASGNGYECLSRYAVVSEDSGPQYFEYTGKIVADGTEYSAELSGTVRCGADGISVVYETLDIKETDAQ